jgi:uncharacterized protein (TIGR03083 family)
MDYAAALLTENARFGDLIREDDLSVEVPTCPGWTLRQLFRHLGRGHRWAAQIVRERTEDFVDPRTVPNGKPPEDHEQALRWLQESAQAVLDAVAESGETTPVWTFLGPRPASWWIRRRLHEATVHRADAALALGLPYELAPDLAADAVGEWLDRLAAERREGHPRPLDTGTSLYAEATDGAGRWLVTGGDEGISWRAGQGDAAVTIRGRASDVLLAMTRRYTLEEANLQVSGDRAVWDDWLGRTPF